LPPRVAIELKSLRSPLRTDSKRLTCLTCEREGSPPRSRLARQKNESAVKAFLILRVLLGFPALSKNDAMSCLITTTWMRDLPKGFAQERIPRPGPAGLEKGDSPKARPPHHSTWRGGQKTRQ